MQGTVKGNISEIIMMMMMMIEHAYMYEVMYSSVGEGGTQLCRPPFFFFITITILLS
jgi:hypothetical protein